MQMGCLTPDGFTIERVRHLEEMVIRCFALHDGEYNFTEADMEIGAVAGALVPRIMHEGYRRHLSEQRLGLLFQQMGGKYLCRTLKFFDYLPSIFRIDCKDAADRYKKYIYITNFLSDLIIYNMTQVT